MRPLVVLAAALLLGLAANAGIVQPVFAADATYTVWGTLGLTVLASLHRSTRLWVLEHGLTLLLGLFGTVVGFWQALEGLAAVDDVAKLAGVATALTTTIVGLVAHGYLLLLERVGR